jgi:hypothetical protein
LVIDCWDTELVTVGTRVPVGYAVLFGDGRQEFPRAALLGSGASEEEVKRVRDARLVREPLDVTTGRQRSRIAELPPGRLVDVTWRATVAEFIGEPYAGSFKGLRRYARDEDLRILSKRG